MASSKKAELDLMNRHGGCLSLRIRQLGMS